MKKEFTAKEAAEILGISDSRVRQLALANEIDHKYFGKSLVVTELGILQANARQTSPGRKKKNKAA